VVNILIRVVKFIGNFLYLIFQVDGSTEGGWLLSVLNFVEHRIVCNGKGDKDFSVGNDGIGLSVDNLDIIVDKVSRGIARSVNGNLDIQSRTRSLDDDDFSFGLKPICNLARINGPV